MTDTQAKFYSANEKRLILVVEDELINRELLCFNIQDQYELLTAETAAEALDLMRTHNELLSVVLLDLMLPDMHGLDVLREMKQDARLSQIPVIVLTAEEESEVECLKAGAVDFIRKPYPAREVILARINRTIELTEDRNIIRSTERDQLTGLYNREYFYRYAEQFDLYHRDLAMDAIVIDINHFHILNERYGKNYGDQILRKIGTGIRDAVQEEGGIVCRREADTFLIYCPHRSDYNKLLDSATRELTGNTSLNSRVRLRMGVYSDTDKSIDIEQRFDRAKLAADTVRNSFARTIAIYDKGMHDAELFAEQLLDSFNEAIEQKQFVVYYQPKFHIQHKDPLLNSAEALVRWQHPELGMVSPGVFIPLFEENGLIQQLDSYVWREVAAQMRDWKDRLGICLPVSVNVSRVDMYDTDLVQNMKNLVEQYALNPSDFLLEITESAYTQDSEQIINTVNQLRQVGFRIEMDDFGTGYSSLNMISTLPIDALKLDMVFIRNAFKERKDTRMLEIVLEIADSLGVPTIAEGVETAEQMFTLRAMGCDFVQGYYFSRPIPAEKYEGFLQLRKNQEASLQQSGEYTTERNLKPHRFAKSAYDKFTYEALHDPVTGLYNQSAFEMLLEEADQKHLAIMIASVDGLKTIAEEQGKAMAEQVVRRVADQLRQSFRAVDYICRIRNDEFVVILSRVNSSMRQLLQDKTTHINRVLSAPEDGTVPVSLSAGVAFSDRENPQGNLFQDAVSALSRLKTARKGGCEFF